MEISMEKIKIMGIFAHPDDEFVMRNRNFLKR